LVKTWEFDLLPDYAAIPVENHSVILGDDWHCIEYSFTSSFV